MDENRWIIVYGKYENLEKKALDLLNAAVFDIKKTLISFYSAEEISNDLLCSCNVILVGTKKDNKLIAKLSADKVIEDPACSQGYSALVDASVYNAEKDMIVVSGYDDLGVLYGSVDLINQYLGSSVYFSGIKNVFPDNYMFFTNPLQVRCPHWKSVSAPTVETRGIWTWGHVICDYKSFFDNMALLKLNQITIWNDFAPLNANDIVDYAHSLGIKVIWGFAWGWDTNCNVSMGMDDESVSKLSDDIFRKYEKEYACIKGDGIYFQSATELDSEYIGGKLIAETVVELVNITSGKILKKYPELSIQFGLHANSVKKRLEFIKKVDDRVKIVWENCGPAFPFLNHSGTDVPITAEEFDETLSFVETIAQLRSENDNFGCVLKEMTFLDWSLFTHIGENTIIGECSERYSLERLMQKRKQWRFIQANWIKNLKYMQKTIKRIVDLRKDNNIQAVVEDGLFEKEIALPVALYAETLWDCSKESDETIDKVMLFPCVKLANV